MGERLRALGGAMQWNTELTALEQHADHVGATLKMPDGSSRMLTAAWVAGCDGAHSAVRELNAIDFPGAPYEHVFFVADVEMTGTMVPDEVNVYLWKSGFHLFFPMRGTDHWRIVGIVPPALRGNDALAFDAVAPSIRGEAGSTLAFKSCSWFSTYRIHHRAAAQFRDRALLRARRRGARPQPGRRAGHEHRFAGRLQPRMEARARRAGQGRRGAARFVWRRAHPGCAMAAAPHRRGLQARRVRQRVRRICCAPK